jgi:hypothetical protein
MTYRTKINLIVHPNSAQINRVTFNEIDEFDLDLGDPLYELIINLGSNELPRFSCACHKANVAMRIAIKKYKPFYNQLRARLEKYYKHYLSFLIHGNEWM